MALSNQYYNVDDKLVNQSIVKKLFLLSAAHGGDERKTGSLVEANERNHKSE